MSYHLVIQTWKYLTFFSYMISFVLMALVVISVPYFCSCLASFKLSGLSFLTICWISQIQHVCVITRAVQNIQFLLLPRIIGGLHFSALFEVRCDHMSCFGK